MGSSVRRMVGLTAAAMVVGLGVPALVRAQGTEEARRASCATNLKQISTGLLMYAQDYDERLPPAGKWTTVVMPYIRNRQVFRCPSDSSPWSYAYNRNLSGVSLAQVVKPFDTAWVFEANFHKPNASGLAKDAVLNRHLGGSNFAYVDGHVKWSPKAPPFGPISKPAPRKSRR